MKIVFTYSIFVCFRISNIYKTIESYNINPTENKAPANIYGVL